jgi:hypothetical protein
MKKFKLIEIYTDDWKRIERVKGKRNKISGEQFGVTDFLNMGNRQTADRLSTIENKRKKSK